MIRSNVLHSWRSIKRTVNVSTLSSLSRSRVVLRNFRFGSVGEIYFPKCSSVREFSTTPGDDSTKDESLESDATIRPKLRVKHVLKNMDPTKVITLSHHSTINEATAHLMQEKLSSCLTVDENGIISGIFTAVDILKFINANHLIGGLRNPTDPLLKTKIHHICTHANKLVYCSPNDTVKRCREVR